MGKNSPKEKLRLKLISAFNGEVRLTTDGKWHCILCDKSLSSSNLNHVSRHLDTTGHTVRRNN